MKSIVTSKGQITIPLAIRKQAHLKAGSVLDFRVESDGLIVANVITRNISNLKGIVKSKRRNPPSLEEMKEAISTSIKGRMK